MSDTLVQKFEAAVASVDLNGNGIPDFRDPAMLALLGHLLARGIISASPAHSTWAKTLSQKYEDAYGSVRP